VTWTFGDGTSGGGLRTDHAFARAGTYSAEAVVTDVAGARSVAPLTVTVTATAPAAPTARITTSP
jgi:hypothetical protein